MRPAKTPHDGERFLQAAPRDDKIVTMLQKFGFFHQGDEQLDPISSLRASLKERSQQEDLSDCLIVAPEGFNIRNGYFDEKRRSRDPSIKESLVNIATEFGVAIVVGLIEEDNAGERGYSSAYLIDGTVCHLLSRKVGPDGSDNYKCHVDGSRTPVLHRGVAIGALICRDASRFNGLSDERRTAFEDSLNALDAPHTVLCVPAHMQTIGSESVAGAWRMNFTVVVANAGSSQPSVIRPGGESPGLKSFCFQEPVNKLCI